MIGLIISPVNKAVGTRQIRSPISSAVTLPGESAPAMLRSTIGFVCNTLWLTSSGAPTTKTPATNDLSWMRPTRSRTPARSSHHHSAPTVSALPATFPSTSALMPIRLPKTTTRMLFKIGSIVMTAAAGTKERRTARTAPIAPTMAPDTPKGASSSITHRTLRPMSGLTRPGMTASPANVTTTVSRTDAASVAEMTSLAAWSKALDSSCAARFVSAGIAPSRTAASRIAYAAAGIERPR